MNSKHKKLTDRARGFTIIEVVLVLAIAGLIFLMVFIALPALQRGQRDGQRKSDLSRISTQLQNYSGAARGGIPTTAAQINDFKTKYLTPAAEWVDPSGANYALTANATNPTNTDTVAFGAVYYTNAALCDDAAPGNIRTGTGVNARNYAIRVKLENQKSFYCLDNR